MYNAVENNLNFITALISRKELKTKNSRSLPSSSLSSAVLERQFLNQSTADLKPNKSIKQAIQSYKYHNSVKICFESFPQIMSIAKLLQQKSPLSEHFLAECRILTTYNGSSASHVSFASSLLDDEAITSPRLPTDGTPGCSFSVPTKCNLSKHASND